MWKSFWKWALPKKSGALSPAKANALLKTFYEEPIRAMLTQRKTLIDQFFRDPPTIEEQVGEALEFDLPGERAYYRLKLWWANNKPIITTPKKRDEYYD